MFVSFHPGMQLTLNSNTIYFSFLIGYAFTVWGCTHIFILCGLTSISLLKDIYTYDHYLTKVADNQDKRAVIQKQIKELQAHRDNITRDRFVQYAVNNNWPGIENWSYDFWLFRLFNFFLIIIVMYYHTSTT